MRIDPSKHYPPIRIRLVGKKGVMVDISYPVEFASDANLAAIDVVLSKVLSKINADESYYDCPDVKLTDQEKIVDYPSEIKEEKEDTD